MSKPNPLYSHEDKEIFKPKIFNLPFFVLKLPKVQESNNYQRYSDAQVK